MENETTEMQGNGNNILSEVLKQLVKQGEINSGRYENEQARADEMHQKYLGLYDKMLSAENEAGTGNPFIDMLNGYVRMKKQKDPNYKWSGLINMVGGLFNKRGDQRPIAPYSDKYDTIEMPQMNDSPLGIRDREDIIPKWGQK